MLTTAMSSHQCLTSLADLDVLAIARKALLLVVWMCITTKATLLIFFDEDDLIGTIWAIGTVGWAIPGIVVWGIGRSAAAFGFLGAVVKGWAVATFAHVDGCLNVWNDVR
jgi:hypothetical protein